MKGKRLCSEIMFVDLSCCRSISNKLSTNFSNKMIHINLNIMTSAIHILGENGYADNQIEVWILEWYNKMEHGRTIDDKNKESISHE